MTSVDDKCGWVYTMCVMDLGWDRRMYGWLVGKTDGDLGERMGCADGFLIG